MQWKALLCLKTQAAGRIPQLGTVGDILDSLDPFHGELG